MKCLFYPEYEKLEIREVPDPEPANGELLVRVSACGICGSELGSYRSKSERRKPPLIMGHEFAGKVETVGPGCSNRFESGEGIIANSLVCPEDGYQTGIGNPHLSPDRHLFGMHRPGGFAEYVCVPEIALLKCPENLPHEIACLAEPVANGVHVFNLAKHEHVERAAIIGAGPIGLFCMQVLRAKGIDCITISDVSDGRLEIARELGATSAWRSDNESYEKEVEQLTDGNGFDLCIDAAGNNATKQLSLDLIRAGGITVWIGLGGTDFSFNGLDLTVSEKKIFGTFGARQEEMQDAIDLLSSGVIDASSWIDYFTLNESVTAFERMLAPVGRDLKAVIRF